MFISFEGIDGCGKTSQSKLLEKYFIEKGHKVLCVREPGGTILSEKVRDILLDKSSDISDVSELLLFETARYELVNKVIRPALQNDVVVLSDRFTDSTIAYQGYGRGLDIAMIKNLNRIASQGLQPDITFYLKLDLSTSKRRQKVLLARLEQEDNNFSQRIIDGFDAMAQAEPQRIMIIDSTLSKEEVHKKIISFLENKN
jgi:dTMP kinase